MRPATLRAAIGAALFCGSLLLFGGATRFDFVTLDDPQYVLDNVHVQGGVTRDALVWAFTSVHDVSWHPLTSISHMLDYQWFGRSAAGHHAVSVLLHAVNAVLAFVALRRLTGAVWASAVCAALFAWHPLRAESVAWISERKDVLSGTFFLATLWAYAGYARTPTSARVRQVGWYALALLAFALGLLSKAMLVTLPFVLLLLDLWPLRRLGVGAAGDPTAADPSAGTSRWRRAARLVAEKVPFLALSILASAVTYHVQDQGRATLFVLPLELRLSNALVSIAAYVGDTPWPAGLAAPYHYPSGYPATAVAAAVALCAAATALALWQVRRRPWLLVGWLWFVGMLVPVIGLVQVGMQPRADRYTYLPSLGLLVALVWTARDLLRDPNQRRAAFAAVAVLVLAYAVPTWRQVQVWRDSIALFENAVTVTTDNYFAHAYLGSALLEAGRTADAEQQFRRVLEIEPAHVGERQRWENDYAIRYELGLALLNQQRFADAGEQFARVLEKVDDYREANNHLGVILGMQGRLAEARVRFESAIRHQPDRAPAYANLAKLLALQGDLDGALPLYRRAVALEPDDPATHCNLAEALAATGLAREAAAHRERARQLVGDPAACPATGAPAP